MESIQDENDDPSQFFEETFKRLMWKPVSSNLFSEEFVSTLDYDYNEKILGFNSDLSSLLGVIAQNPDIQKMYFPQSRMYYNSQPPRLSESEDQLRFGAQWKEPLFSEQISLFEGFVVLNDEGYTKSIYVNQYIPYDKIF